MEFPQGYTLALTDEQRQEHWPSLQENVNFKFTSLKRKQYNCAGWAIRQNKDLDMLAFKEIYDLDPMTLDHTVQGYAIIFKERYGYEVCETLNVEDEYEKIVLYGDPTKDFVHVARQLPNGRWTSKMGRYEDIEHYTLDAVGGRMYGRAMLFMKKKKELIEDAFKQPL